LPVEIFVYSDKTFTFITKQPPVSRLILKEVGIESGSKVPNRDKVGKLTKSQVKKIVDQKRPDMRVRSDEAAMQLVMGTARSMGVDIIEG
jgi:large subunit ribosomal protein L11